MKKLEKKSLFHLGVRQKVLLALMLVLLTALSVSGWFALQEEKKNILKEIERRGSDISRFVAKSLVYSVVGYDYHTIDLLLKEITLSEDVGYSRVENLNGRTMAESGKLVENEPSKMVLFKQKLTLDDEVVGTLLLGLSTENTMKRLEKQKYALIKREAIIIMLIAFGEFIALSYIIIKPVSIISKSLHEREDEQGKMMGIIPITTNDEFGELALQFNALSHNLNMANAELKSRIDYANEQLINTNNLLLERSRELMQLNEEFKNLSITDSLTGLYNRRHFKEVFQAEMEISKRHGDVNSLMVIDIDHFKKINDKYGHTQGDAVIQMVAELMQGRLRETDVLCRIGGEEFVAICRRADKDSSIKLAENLRNTIADKRLNFEGETVKVTVSIGISTVMPENIDIISENCFKFADAALYYSKDHGRNRVTHFDDMEKSELKL